MKRILTTAAVLLAGTTASAATISTIAQQNSTVSSWGAGPATEIYGQSFTTTTGGTLTGFDFLINDTGAAMNFNAYVYAWGGLNVIGPAVFVGSGSTNGINGLSTVTVNATGTLNANTSYIAYLEATSNGFAEFGSVFADAHTGGEFVFQDTSIATGRVFSPWTGDVQGTDYDLAFEVRIGDDVAPVPVPAALPLLALGLGALGFAHRRS